MQDSGELVMPEGYNAGNALKSAWLYLQNIENGRGIKVIDSCTKESICDCLLQMCVNGEYPMKHFYFIPYGNKLTFQERYLGKLMRTKRDTDVENVYAQCVYENDNFVYTVDEFGRYQLVKHETSLDNIDIAKIKAAYAIVKYRNGDKQMVVMTRQQIQKSWEQSPTGGKSKAHNNFTDEMCKRTVISRACKVDVDSAPDRGFRINQGTEDDDFSMLPPDASEAERQLANGGGSRAALPNSRPDAFEECFARVNHWHDRGRKYLPHCQPYLDFTKKKQNIPQWQKDLASWADKKWIFQSCEFKDFQPRKGFICKQYFNMNLK